VSGLGIWDDTDITVSDKTVSDKTVSVKSTKHFGKLMLLEADDWNHNGIYKSNDKKYDYMVLVRIYLSCEVVIKSGYSNIGNECDYTKLKNIICSQKWTYDYVGYILADELKHIIEEKYIIPKDAMLNGRHRMNVLNYYVQAGDMHPINRNE